MDFHLMQCLEVPASRVKAAIESHPESDRLKEDFAQLMLLPNEKPVSIDRKDLEALEKGTQSVTDVRKSKTFANVSWCKKRLASEPVESTAGNRAAPQSRVVSSMGDRNVVEEEVATSREPDVET